MRNHLLDLNPQELKQWLTDHNHSAYRADQIFQWLYQQRVKRWKEMANLPAPLQQELAQAFFLYRAELQNTSQSKDGTCKLLLRWPDGQTTETVMIPDKKRVTVCVSSQVGCPVRCAFCASGLDGLERSLHSGEIVEQLLWVARRLDPDQRISNVVFMGMGEPLANYDHVIRAVKIINAPWALGIGARHITISSVGLPERIRKLAHEPLQFTLAISLHSGDEAVRQSLIPWVKRTTTDELFEAINYFYQQTHREVTLEYIILDGINNLIDDAEKLTHWAKQSRCNVNLIHYNEVSDLPFKRASAQSTQQFKQWLVSRGINAHIRPSRGRDIDAACGQLRRRIENNENQSRELPTHYV